MTKQGCAFICHMLIDFCCIFNSTILASCIVLYDDPCFLSHNHITSWRRVSFMHDPCFLQTIIGYDVKGYLPQGCLLGVSFITAFQIYWILVLIEWFLPPPPHDSCFVFVFTEYCHFVASAERLYIISSYFTDHYDVVVSVGGFASDGHVKPDCFPEMIRIIKPGNVYQTWYRYFNTITQIRQVCNKFVWKSLIGII